MSIFKEGKFCEMQWHSQVTFEVLPGRDLHLHNTSVGALSPWKTATEALCGLPGGFGLGNMAVTWRPVQDVFPVCSMEARQSWLSRTLCNN